MGEESGNVNFFTPVHYEDPSSFKEALLQNIDNYFYLGGRKAVVLSDQTGVKDKTVELKNIPTSGFKKLFFGALKVVSYLTVIMPLLMLGLKMALRWNTKFHTVNVLSAPPSAPQAGDIFVFGDVHGELVGFHENLEHAGLIDGTTKHWRGGAAIAIQMGDVLDRGPQSKESYHFLETLQQEAPKVGGQVVRLIGNHELMMLQGEFHYVDKANIPDPKKMAEKIKEDIKSGKIQLAYSDGTRLYIHAGLRSEIRERLINEIRKKEGGLVPIDPTKLATYLNQLLIDAVTNDDFSHPVFWAGKSRGGDKPIGGGVWEDFKGMLNSMHAHELAEVIAHSPPQEGERFIKITDSMRLINVDAGLCKVYGGHNAYVKIAGGKVSTFEKVKGAWQHFQQIDKLQKPKPSTPTPVGKKGMDERQPPPRKYPPISGVDTVCLRNGKIQSVHGQIKVFADNEILEICPLTDVKMVNGVPIQKMKATGKAVIQQQATRGCTAAAVTMLIVDHGKNPDQKYLCMTNLGDETTMKQAIEEAGLKPLIQAVPNNLSGLRAAIIKNGPAVVSVQEGNGHVVVVDEINKNLDKVTLRDPYHGWAIVVSGKTFQKALNSKIAANTLVQIQA